MSRIIHWIEIIQITDCVLNNYRIFQYNNNWGLVEEPWDVLQCEPHDWVPQCRILIPDCLKYPQYLKHPKYSNYPRARVVSEVYASYSILLQKLGLICLYMFEGVNLAKRQMIDVCTVFSFISGYFLIIISMWRLK